jgi:hypothetical protein
VTTSSQGRAGWSGSSDVHRDDGCAHGHAGASCARAHSTPRTQVRPACPDPQRVQGAFLYTIKMLKNGKEYALEIVVREKDWTILHFLFK